MREVTTTYKVYKFSELSKEAKERVRTWYLDDPFKASVFKDIYEEDLRYLFPDSELKLQFSLSCCQGDGLNIYGELSVYDVFKVIEDKAYAGDSFKEFWDVFTPREKDIIESYFPICGETIKLPMNRRYCYCIANQVGFAEQWIDWSLEYDEFKNIDQKVIRKFERTVIEIFEHLCAVYENYGYKYFYEVDDSDLEEFCEANEYEFLEDGAVA